MTCDNNHPFLASHVKIDAYIFYTKNEGKKKKKLSTLEAPRTKESNNQFIHS